MKGLVIAVVLIVIVLLLLRRRGGGSESKKPKRLAGKGKNSAPGNPREAYPHRATVIVCKSDACDAVKAIAGKPFLASDNATPLIPLPDCDVPNCQCSYQHRDDRRVVEEGDRRLQSTLRDSAYLADGSDNRRIQETGRRHDD